MTNFKNTSEETIKAIAEKVNGKTWIKGDKVRIYVEGGNNYHYDGKWYYEIAEDGSWEAKVYLTEGYNNQNRAEYVAKHLRAMTEELNEALESGEEQTAAPEVKAAPVACITINFGDQPYEYPSNYYNGCGSYLLAFLNGKVVASYNYTHYMQTKAGKAEMAAFKAEVEEKHPGAVIIAADGSDTIFFARTTADAAKIGVEAKIYTVPTSTGGKHKNIELLLK